MNDYYIDREARDVLAAQLRHFLAGLITNREFEARTPLSKDRAVNAASNEAWGLYDDLREHKLTGEYSLPPETRRHITRLIAFLKTDQPWPHPSPRVRLVVVAIVFATLVFLLPWHLWSLALIVAAASVWPLAWLERRRWARAPESQFWPFGSEDAYESALASPRYLSGCRAPN